MSDSLSDMRRTIEEKENQRNQQEQERFQAEQENVQAQLQQQAEAVQMQQELDEGKNIRDNMTRIEVALINARKSLEDGTLDQDGLASETELMKHKDKLELEMKKLQQDMEKHKDNIKVKREQISAQRNRAKSK